MSPCPHDRVGRRRGASTSASRQVGPLYLDDLEAQEAPVEHDDLVLVRALVHHMPQGEQLLLVGQHGAPPGRVTLVADHDFLLEGLDGLIEDPWVFILVGAGELVLGERSLAAGSVRTRELTARAAARRVGAAEVSVQTATS